MHSLSSQDGEVRKAFQRSLTKQGFKFKLNTKVNGAKIEADKVTLDLESKKGEKETFEADVVLVSAGMLSPSLNKLLCKLLCKQQGNCSHKCSQRSALMCPRKGNNNQRLNSERTLWCEISNSEKPPIGVTWKNSSYCTGMHACTTFFLWWQGEGKAQHSIQQNMCNTPEYHDVTKHCA